jgi:hypothetical protein
MSLPTRATDAGQAYLDLQNMARSQRRGTQELLTLYVVERWLARLSQSPFASDFVIKGAACSWRPTSRGVRQPISTPPATPAIPRHAHSRRVRAGVHRSHREIPKPAGTRSCPRVRVLVASPPSRGSERHRLRRAPLPGRTTTSIPRGVPTTPRPRPSLSPPRASPLFRVLRFAHPSTRPSRPSAGESG